MPRALVDSDPVVFRILEAERRRQREGVELIPSENYVSAAVLEAMGTIFTNKYSEGYPGRRYYGGNEFVDDVERLPHPRVEGQRDRDLLPQCAVSRESRRLHRLRRGVDAGPRTQAPADLVRGGGLRAGISVRTVNSGPRPTGR